MIASGESSRIPWAASCCVVGQATGLAADTVIGSPPSPSSGITAFFGGDRSTAPETPGGGSLTRPHMACTALTTAPLPGCFSWFCSQLAERPPRRPTISGVLPGRISCEQRRRN